MMLFLYYIVFIFLLVMLGNLTSQLMRWQNDQHNFFYSISIDFFAGYAVFFSMTRLLERVFHSNLLAIGITCALSLAIFIVTYKKYPCPFKKYLRFACFFIPIWSIVFVFVILNWTQGNPFESPYTSTGSLHSGRYSNIILYILSNDRIPIISQNYAQSVMAAVPLLLAGKVTYLSLATLLSIALTFITFITFGFFRRSGYGTWRSVLFTAFTILSVSSLSLRYIVVVDSGWPLFLNGYADSMIGLGTFFILILFIRENIKKDAWQNKWIYVFIGCNLVLWTASAVQNIYFLFIFLLLTLLPYRKNIYTLFTDFKLPMTILLAGLLAGIISGGMVTPKALRDQHISVPGLQTIDINTNKVNGIQFSPGMPIRAFLLTPTDSGVGFHINIQSNLRPSYGTGFISTFKKIFLDYGVCILLAPVLFLLAFYVKTRKKPGENSGIDFTFSASVIFLISGLLIVFPFSVSGYKWELTRFLIPGLFFCNLFLPVCLYDISKKYPLVNSRVTFVLLLIAFVSVPVWFSIKSIESNIYLLHKFDVFKIYLTPITDYVKQ